MIEIEGDINAPPPEFSKPAGAAGWEPDLNPAQREEFNCADSFILHYGEKGSGKSIVGLHKLVRHCYENPGALAIIASPSIRTGAEGVLFDLTDLVLPTWRDGNRWPAFKPDGITPHPQAGELKDNGIGLEFTPVKLDPQTKDRFLHICSQDGTPSKVIIISIPYEDAVEARIKALSPSMVYMDELTECDGKKYFTFVAAQLGRRRNIKGAQQYVASCNPKGPSHWVYQVFWEDHVRRNGGKWDPRYHVRHIPIQENVHRIGKAYVDNLESLFTDEVDRRRLLHGEWVDRPTGQAIFRDYFRPNIHVRGDKLKDTGITPKPGFPIIIGYDPGPVNFCVTLEQLLIAKGANNTTFELWTVFDELNYVGRAPAYWRIVADICNVMDQWSQFGREKYRHEFNFEHISDQAAFNQITNQGDFEVREIEKLCRIHRETHPGPVIKMKPCEKGNHTVPARVRLIQGLLQREALLVSALCPKTQDMLLNLESAKADPNKYDPMSGLTPTKGPYNHPFDSMSYPIFYYSLRSGVQVGNVQSSVYHAGATR